MPVNLNGMDPRVLAALKKIQDEARARGIETSVISGVRSRDDQEQLYANYQAGLRHMPLPYPARGAVPLAAAPGTSEHERGDAFDLQATDPSRQSELWGLAPSVGLTALGVKDPAHFQLGGGVERTGYAATPTSGRSFLEALQHFESHGSNVPNTHQTTSSGQAQGFNQITTGTWADFGGTRYAPDALHATKAQQDEIASSIPLKRWAPETLNYLKSQGFKLDPNATLGENIAMNGGTLASGASPVANGAPAGGDWTSLLGATPPTDDAGLGSILGDAVQPSKTAPSMQASSGIDVGGDLPEIDQSYALASDTPEMIGARYQQNKGTRKLSPLGELFTLPTIGPQQPVASRAPVRASPYNMGIG